jgi:hypothetical protein
VSITKETSDESKAAFAKAEARIREALKTRATELDLSGLDLAKSEVHPRPRLRDDLKFEHPPAGQSSGPTVRWVTGIDSEKLWEDLGRKLDRALREQGRKP